MTNDDLSGAQLAIGLRLSTHEPVGLTYEEWGVWLERRVKFILGHTTRGERPPHDLALFLAADATAFLVEIAKAEELDHTMGEAA